MKYVGYVVVGVSLSVAEAWTALKLYEWFVRTPFHAPELTLWAMFGMRLLVSALWPSPLLGLKMPDGRVDAETLPQFTAETFAQACRFARRFTEMVLALPQVDAYLCHYDYETDARGWTPFRLTCDESLRREQRERGFWATAIAAARLWFALWSLRRERGATA